ncbi:uncharacterized protein A4U43_C01F12770 [Asparagus officinalis]|uniref:Uncharacterized protein n=1 Tax=Asparagus officinalis TaxID=4686 RepID=A0A5P1FNX2_ASPOF|nr:protein POLLENLESS 3-LIKE 2 [Asparagus officinalis]ONK80006.1 uncharacterized protein A4U43_C01F12770 [Asparagus officinalis]
MLHQDLWSINAPTSIRPSKSAPCSPIKPMPMPRSSSESFHVAFKVPVGDTPYVRAKRVQLVDKDPERAIALFWAAINAGDRVDSALKDMAIVMKQQNRAEEAIEAIKSLRHRCTDQAQESLDNILLDLYKRCGRLDDQIGLLRRKLQLIQQGLAFNGKRTKTARSQGKKFQVSVEQEATRLLGNLGWALMQKENYKEAEEAYRRALIIGPDNNKMCNLGICLMKQGRINEAKETLRQVKSASINGLRGTDSHLKAYERAQEMLRDLESKVLGNNQSWLFDAFIGSSLIWKPQPCTEFPMNRNAENDKFANENVVGIGRSNSLNIDAPPFYSSRMLKDCNDPMGNLKRTRSGNIFAEKWSKQGEIVVNKRRSLSFEEGREKWPELPDTNAFDEAIMAAVLAPVLEDESFDRRRDQSLVMDGGQIGKRLRVFEDITLAMNNSPKAKDIITLAMNNSPKAKILV